MTRRRRHANKSMARAAPRARGDSHAARDSGTAEPPRKPLKVADGYQGKAAAVPLFRVGVTYFEAFAPPRWPTQILGVPTRNLQVNPAARPCCVGNCHGDALQQAAGE
jgi:hypothetical protein